MGIAARIRSVDGLLLVVGALLLFVRLGAGSLVNEDEARYALVAQEMIESGDPWTPTLRGDPWFNKAPLRIWCTAALGSVAGVDPWTVRLPSALFALGTVGMVLALGRALLDEASARWGAFVLIGSTLFVHHHCARTGETDSAALFFWVLAVWAAVRAVRAGHVDDARHGGGGPGLGHARWLLLAGAATGAAAMAKHLFYVVPVGGTALLALMLVGAGRNGAPGRAGPTRMPWRGVLAGTGTALLVLAPWHLAMLAVHGRAFLDTYLGREVAHRVAVDHAAGLDPTLPLRVLVDGLYPWVVAMVALTAVAGWRQLRHGGPWRRWRAFGGQGAGRGARSSAAEPGRREGVEADRGSSAAERHRPATDRAVLLLGLWAALVVIGVWVTRVELTWYVLGAVPPLALLGGRLIATGRLSGPLIVLVSVVIALSPSNVTWFDPHAVRAVNGRPGVDLFGVLQGADPWWPAVAVGLFGLGAVALVRHDPIERRRAVLAAWSVLALLQVGLPLTDPTPTDPLDRLVAAIDARGRAPQQVVIVADAEQRRPDLDLFSFRRLDLPWRIVDEADDLRPAPDRWILVRAEQAPPALGRNARREGPWWLVPPSVEGAVPRASGR